MNSKIIFNVENFSVVEENPDSQFATVSIDAFASGDNCHHLYVSEETLKKTADTIREKPILWVYDKRFEDAGSHDPLQVPAGFIPENTPIEYRELPDGRTMMTVFGKIWKHYSGKLLEIFKRDGFKKSVSVEMVVDEAEEKDGKKELLSYQYTGLTILGEFIQPAIKSAQMTVLSFANEYKDAYELEFGKYDDFDFKIPAKVKENAKRALELKKKSGGGSSVSLAVARHLLSNEFTTPERVKQIHKYLSKRETEIDDDDDLQYNLYGGRAAKNWSRKLVDQMKKKDDERLSYFSDDEKSSVEEKDMEKDEEEKVEAEKEEMAATESEPETKSDNPEEEKKEKEFSEDEKEETAEEEEKEEKQEEEGEKEDMSLDAYLDASAALAFLEEETDSYREMVSCHSAGTADFAYKFAGYMFARIQKMSEDAKKVQEEFAALKQFKADYEKQQFEFAVAGVLEEIRDTMPKKEYDECVEDSKNYDFSNVNIWANAVKAKAFAFAKGKKNDDGINRIALPFNDGKEDKKKSLWD